MTVFVPRFAPVFAAALFAAGLALAAEPAGKSAKPGKPSPKTAVDPSSPFSAAEYGPVREGYRKQKEKADSTRMDKLKALLQQNLAAAEKNLKEKKNAGNIKGTAIWHAAKVIFEEMIADLEKRKTFDVPETVRRELSDTMDACRTARNKIETDYSNEMTRAEVEFLPQFMDVASKTGLSGDLRQKFHEFVQIESAPPPPPSTGGVARVTGQGTNVTGVATNAAGPPPEIIACSGPGGDRWVTVARWTGQIVGMDVFKIPIYGRPEVSEAAVFCATAHADNKVKYEALQPLPRRNDYAFRLKRISGMEAVEWMAWPSVANSQALMVRTRPVQQVTPCGFLLQVSLPEKDLQSQYPGVVEDESGVSTQAVVAVTGAPPSIVKLAIATKPAGAQVYLDNEQVTDENGPRKTPCVLTVQPGIHSLRVSMLGYLDQFMSNRAFNADREIEIPMQPDPRIVRKKIIVPAKGKWASSNVKIRRGDHVSIEATGKWICGKKGDECGPNGYEVKDAYLYYIGGEQYARQVMNANYGALIMKINANGVPQGVRNISIKEEGTLFFDINELEDAKWRKDNSGQIEVDITVIPRK